MKSTVFDCSVHLPDADLMAACSACPFCAATKRMQVAVLQEEPDVALLHCRNCHAASASRMPRPEALEKYYSNYYNGTEEKITSDTPDRLASHIVRYATPSMGNLTGRDISILDFGGGDSSISTRVAHEKLDQGARRVNTALVDHDQSTMEGSADRIQITRPDELAQISGRSMDLVIASAVVEHIPEPREVLLQLLAALRSGGVFYARTPYVLPLSRIAKTINTKFDFTYPAHVHDLGSRFWNNVIHILPLDGAYQVIRSTPSIVETSFSQHFLRTLAAHVLKMPGYVFKETYGLVGGWEVFIRCDS